MELDRLTELFKILGDPTRLRIMHLLICRRPLCVQTLQKVLGSPQPTVSRHLAELRKAHLVTASRVRQRMHYSLSPNLHPYQEMLVDCIRDHYTTLPELREDLAVFDRLEAAGDLCCA